MKSIIKFFIYWFGLASGLKDHFNIILMNLGLFFLYKIIYLLICVTPF